MVRQSLIREGVQPAGIGVVLDLLVSEIGLICGKPIGKLVHVAGVKRGNVLFDLFELGYGVKVSWFAVTFHLSRKAYPHLARSRRLLPPRGRR